MIVKTPFRQTLFLYSYILLLLVMLVLPFFSVEEYSILRNTTSHLGAQGAPNAWIMNTVFILLGTTCMWKGVPAFRRYPFQQVVLIFFGLSLVATGFFQHKPIVAGIPFNAFEDQMHSLFASVVGFSFTVFAMSLIWIESERNRKLQAFGMALLAMILSILIFNLSDYAGIWQRVMFASSFGWMIMLFQRRSEKG